MFLATLCPTHRMGGHSCDQTQSLKTKSKSHTSGINSISCVQLRFCCQLSHLIFGSQSGSGLGTVVRREGLLLITHIGLAIFQLLFSAARTPGRQFIGPIWGRSGGSERRDSANTTASKGSVVKSGIFSGDQGRQKARDPVG